MNALASQPLVLGDLLNGLVDDLDAAMAAVPVSGLAMDSREVRAGDVFLACRGAEADGRDFIADAVERGAAAIIADAPVDAAAWSLPVVALERLGMRVSDIAGRYYAHPSASMNLVGVTGTNGKTSVAHIVAQLLEAMDLPCGLMGTLGNGRIGDLQDTGNTTASPLAIQAQLAQWCEAGADWVAMEVSSHGLEQGRVEALQFKAAVFTNLSPEHLDYHGDMASYAEAKQRLFARSELQLAVINADDEYAGQMLAALPASCTALRFSLADNRKTAPGEWGASENELRLADIRFGLQGCTASLQSPWGEAQLRLPLLGRFNLANAVAAIACLAGLGLDFYKLCTAAEALHTVPGRMQVIRNENAPLVVIDYAHTADALEQALSSLRPHCGGELWLVFGCGGDRDQAKREPMGAVAERLADRVVLSSDNPRSESAEDIIQQILKGMQAEPLAVEPAREQAISRAITAAGPEDIVLIAGKGHETYQEFSGKRHHFDDAEQARMALALRQPLGGVQ